MSQRPERFHERFLGGVLCRLVIIQHAQRQVKNRPLKQADQVVKRRLCSLPGPADKFVNGLRVNGRGAIVRFLPVY